VSHEGRWVARFLGVTALAGVSAVLAHLLAGGAIASSLGFFLGVVSSALIAVIVLYRPGFFRTALAMLAGQYSFHIFLGVGASNPHQHHVVAPLVGLEPEVSMGVAHLVAAASAAVVVAGADRALRVLAHLIIALSLPARLLMRPTLVVVKETTRAPRSFLLVRRLVSTEPVGSLGLRGPPAFV
jgi:hypothetical protein